MMPRPSLKRLFLMLLAVFLTTGFSISAAEASVVSAAMKMTADDRMAIPTNAGMGKMADVGMKVDRKVCLKGTGENGNPMRCPPTCISPLLALVPQGLAVATARRLRQLSALPAALLRGRGSPPEPFPPRSST